MQLTDGRVISKFFVRALRNQPASVYNDGSQTRLFRCVSDKGMALDFIVDCAEDVMRPTTLGNPAEIGFCQLAELFMEKTGSRSKIVEKPLLSDDPTQRCLDITRAQEVLEWSPSVSFDDRLDAAIRQFEKMLGVTGGRARYHQNCFGCRESRLRPARRCASHHQFAEAAAEPAIRGCCVE